MLYQQLIKKADTDINTGSQDQHCSYKALSGVNRGIAVSDMNRRISSECIRMNQQSNAANF